ncbi:hypothetical protein C8Q76DRAFT_716898 [Earliella scabrosa]|nr:hypothetical protein C8Q76DRAFT_716898 [Earliella scabrosa]
MRFTTATFVAGLFTAVSAHFQLQFPPPRGPFVASREPTFCDGYADVTTNRTVFPTDGGFVSLNIEHPTWTLGGIVSTVANPNTFPSFQDSNGQFQQFIPFFRTTGEGAFCLNVSLADWGISGIQDGANVTVQFIFDGGDDTLYQCADLTLRDNATIPDNVACTNATNAAVTPVSSSISPTGTAPAGNGSDSGSDGSSGSGSGGDNGAIRNGAIGMSAVAGLLGFVAVLL